MNEVLLFTTLGCHLCEDAKQVAWPALRAEGIRLREVEIADSDDLMARYGLKIPVLAKSGEAESLAELDWPFTTEDVAALIKSS